MKKINLKKNIIVIVFGIALIFILSEKGCITTFAKSIEGLITNEYALVNEERAKELMYDKVPNSKMVQFTYNENSIIPVFQGKLIKNAKEYDIDIDAKTGIILNYKEEEIKGISETYEGKVITAEEAHEIIIKRAGGGVIKDFKYEGNAAIPTYEGVINKNKNEIAILLDARDGKIIGIDRDDVKHKDV